MMYFCLGIVLLYVLMLLFLGLGVKKVALTERTSDAPKTAFSILIPFRNEARHLPNLIQSLEGLSYPKELFEVICIDDDSEDGYQFPETVLNVRVIPNQRTTASPKKDALLTGIRAATHEWVITTDADCVFPKLWLNYWDARVQHHDVALICGPVSYAESPGFLFRFQQVELWALQGVTLGSFGQNMPLMCNGAHMGYTKSLFYELGGFEGNTQWAGGDDVFLLHKAIHQKPEQVGYLRHPEALVQTQAVHHWKGLFQQRLRWAAKAKAYQNTKARWVALFVFAANLLVIIAQVNFFIVDWVWGIIPLVKIATDDALQRYTAATFQQKVYPAFWSGLVYPWFSVGVAVFALFGTYRWKGRSYHNSF